MTPGNVASLMWSLSMATHSYILAPYDAYGEAPKTQFELLGSKALLTPLYRSMTTRPTVIGLGKQSEVRAALLDLRAMVRSVAACPTHVLSWSIVHPHSLGWWMNHSQGLGAYGLCQVGHQ
jgi:hypothetical protein